jgi:riboflavin synthase
MFTGIIEEIGTVQSIQRGSKSAIITVKASEILEDIKNGDSINTNGACLTVTSFTSEEFTVNATAETIRRTNLNTLQIGSKVNLERALKMGDRLGGHLVSGHIDGTGNITQITKEDNAVWVTIKTSHDLLKYIIGKGSVALDGISLTVAQIIGETFQVSIIPYTGSETTLLSKQTGDIINIECDQVGKYIEKFMHYSGDENKSAIDMQFLKDHGYL